jgi:hypothetical protein
MFLYVDMPVVICLLLRCVPCAACGVRHDVEDCTALLLTEWHH